MRFVCDRASLNEALAATSGVTPTRTPKPILECVRLTASEDSLTLTAYDQEVGLRYRVREVATQQLRVAVTDMYPGSRRGEALGYLLTGSLIGSFIAPVLIFTSGKLSEGSGVNELAMPWLLTPLIIVPAVFAILAVRPDPREIAMNLASYWPGVAQTAKTVRGKMSYREFIRSRPRLTATVCYMPAQGVMSMIMAATPLVLTTHGHSLTFISLAVTIHVFGMFAFAMPNERVEEKRLGAG